MTPEAVQDGIFQHPDLRMIYLKLIEVWNQIENSWKGNPENFFIDKVKQEVAEWCPLYYFFSRNNQTSTTEYCSKLVILFVVPMGILLSFWRNWTYPAVWTMLDWASTLSEDSNDGNWSNYLTLHGWEVLTPVALVTAWIARIRQLTALTDLMFSFLNAKLFGDRETPELNNPETYPQSSWKKIISFIFQPQLFGNMIPLLTRLAGFSCSMITNK